MQSSGTDDRTLSFQFEGSAIWFYGFCGKRGRLDFGHYGEIKINSLGTLHSFITIHDDALSCNLSFAIIVDFYQFSGPESYDDEKPRDEKCLIFFKGMLNAAPGTNLLTVTTGLDNFMFHSIDVLKVTGGTEYVSPNLL